MSDDDDYYEDYFDDDILWLDDGAAAVIEDNTVGTSPSPVYLNDQALYDALDSESDWDYLSDDYYDDDPSIIRRQRARAAADEKKKNKQKNNVAGVSKQLFKDDTGKVDLSTYCSVLYKKPDYMKDQTELYEPGNGEKVALLKNWREIFENSKPKTDRKSLGSFQDRLSSRIRRERISPKKQQDVVGKVQEGDAEDTEMIFLDLREDQTIERTPNGYGSDELERSAPNSPTLSLPPSNFDSTSQDNNAKKPKKKVHSKTDRIQNRGSRLKEVVSARDIDIPPPENSLTPSNGPTPMHTTDSVPDFKILLPPVPKDAQDYKKMNDFSPVAEVKKPGRPGRKRKASLSLDNTSASGKKADSMPDKKAAMSKHIAKSRKLDSKSKTASSSTTKPATRSSQPSRQTRTLRQRRK